jgi:hypothetical protein
MKLSEKIQEALQQQEILSDPVVQKRLAAQWGYVPADAQPVSSVPECPYPCGWRNLLDRYRRRRVFGCMPEIERFAALVAQAEREACAQIVERNASACRAHSELHDILRANAEQQSEREVTHE